MAINALQKFKFLASKRNNGDAEMQSVKTEGPTTGLTLLHSSCSDVWQN